MLDSLPGNSEGKRKSDVLMTGSPIKVSRKDAKGAKISLFPLCHSAFSALSFRAKRAEFYKPNFIKWGGLPFIHRIFPHFSLVEITVVNLCALCAFARDYLIIKHISDRAQAFEINGIFGIIFKIFPKPHNEIIHGPGGGFSGVSPADFQKPAS